MGEGRTKASKAREPVLREALKGKENDSCGCSGLVEL